MGPESHALLTVDAVREIIGAPHRATSLKVLDALDDMAIAFVARCPFLVLATVGENGLPEVSPKGDEPGFVAVEDPTTVLIPERKGNRLIFGLQNILANGAVSAMFMVPGTGETLRVQGRASLTADPQILERLSARGVPALLAIRVTIERCYFHCAKAFKRSKLWEPESWPEPQRISFGTQLARRLGGGDELANQVDEAVAADYRDNL